MSSTAKKLKLQGGKYGIQIALFGITVTYLFFVAMLSGEKFYSRYLWFLDCGFEMILISGAALLLILGYYFGRKTGTEIKTNKSNRSWSGIKCVFSMYLISIFIANLIGFVFLDNGIQNWETMKYNIYSYTFRPVFLFALYGALPMAGFGVLLGRKLGEIKDELNE